MTRGQSLYDWCQENGEWGQQLLFEFGDGNNSQQFIDGCGITMKPHYFTKASNIKIPWKCKDGHTWCANIRSRTIQGSKCPYCSGRRVSDINSLYTWCLEQDKYGQQLIQEWTGICDDGNHYKITEVEGASHKKMLWRCSKGHEWWVSIANRVYNKSQCNICALSNIKMKQGINDLYTWCQYNKEFGQQLIKEWTGICDDNGHYKMNEVTKGSKKKMLWKCSKGHEWYTRICYRTKDMTKCPYCNTRGTSYPEQYIYWSLKQIYPQTISRGKYQDIEFDITVPEEKTCIEYSPTYWHADRHERDQLKADICKEHNVRFIYIMEDSYNEYEEIWNKDYICFHIGKERQEIYYMKIVEYILQSFGHSISEIDIDLVRKKAFEYSQDKIEYEQSLEYNYPELSKEWHPTLNNIGINQVTSGSHYNAFWMCIKCKFGHNGEWQRTIHSRTMQKTGCPACGYNVFDNTIHNSTNTYAINDENKLSIIYPELAKEYSKSNKRSIETFKINSSIFAYWVCPICKYGSNNEWYVSIKQRAILKSGCPKCGYNWADGTLHIRGYKISINGKDNNKSIACKLPELAKEFNSEFNDTLPSNILTGASKNIYWTCPNCKYGEDGNWIVSVNSRTYYKSGCPQCGYNWYKAQTGQPQKIKKGYTLNINTEPEPVKMLPKSNTITKYNETKL